MDRAAVLATGFCAGLVPGMHPGDLVVAEETRDPQGIVTCTGSALLAEALARAAPGRTVHRGALTGSDHVVRGQERAQRAPPAPSRSTWSPRPPCGPPPGAVAVRLRPSG